MARPQKLNSDEVLRRASDLFWKRGCAAVSTRDLEAALDLRAPALYRRFRSKNDLLARSIDHYVDGVVARRIVRVLDGANSPLRGLRTFFFDMLEAHGDEPDLRGCLLTNTAAQQEIRDPEVRAALQRGFDLIRAAFRTQIERSVAHGELSEDTDVRTLSAALFMSLQGLLTLSRTGAPDLSGGIEATFSLLGLEPQHVTADEIGDCDGKSGNK